MKGIADRLAASAALALCLAGCASVSETSSAVSALPAPTTDGTRVETPASPLECVPYARARSGVQLFGNAGTWWTRAEGRYERERIPLLGSVMVLTGYAGPGRGHLGVVTDLISAREIRIDHANWLGDGAIYLDDPVADVSPDNRWTEVRVWNPRSRTWGTRTYLVEGFIGPSRISGPDRIAAE
ncbi:MAG TPA: CHAP domain-containing protein [Rhizomicrobium sp.]|nr:CHAP domain-containing protein [Rhizomicrobium sp.]